jgi:LmbE family N-acetylglucosaminyl deacetylase
MTQQLPSVLIVVAHPDDEVLGCGVAGAALAAAGHEVRACMLSGHAEARGGRPEGEGLLTDLRKAQQELGFGEPMLGSFPNIRLNTVPHIELVRFIEDAIVASNAQIVFTHHPSDLNDDHVQTSRACMAAARLFQRRAGIPPLRKLFWMEILSSTDWSLGTSGDAFRADTFVEAESWLDRKLRALHAYRGVMRPFPHPRSEEIVRGLAAYRGGQAGLRYAEAFQTAFSAGTATQALL